MELGLSDNLPNLHVHVSAVNVVASECPACWTRMSGTVYHNRLGSGSGQSTSLFLDLQPNSIEALKRNLFVFDSTSSQETLIVTVTSESEQGGSDVSQDFRIPIRFTPPGGFVLLSIVCGAFIGCSLRYAISRLSPPKQSILEVGIAAVTALIAWVVVLGLFLTKTKATVFGYDLDPTQMIPAGLITLLAAGGAPFVRRLAEIIGGK